MEQQDKETILKVADYTAGETEDCAEGKDRIAVVIRKCGSDLKDISAGIAICFDRGSGDLSVHLLYSAVELRPSSWVS